VAFSWPLKEKDLQNLFSGFAKGVPQQQACGHISGLLPSQSFWNMSTTPSYLVQKQQKHAPLITLPPLLLDVTSQHCSPWQPVIVLCTLDQVTAFFPMSSKAQTVNTADMVLLPKPNALLEAPHSAHIQEQP